MKIDRSIRPSPSSEISLRIPDIRKYSMENGLDVFFIEKNELPIITVSVVVNAGSKFDSVNHKGRTNLLAMCIDEGAGKYSSLELSEQFDLLGTHISIKSNSDNIQITLQVLKENFSKAMKLLSYLLIKPHLENKDFEREKRKILTMLKQLSDDPDYLANTSFESLLFGKENPYSFPSLGLTEDITNITNEEIRSYYNKSILPNNSFIVTVGDISAEELKTITEEYLSPWQKNKCELEFGLKKKEDDRLVFIVNKKDSVQTEIRVGHHTSGRNSEKYFDKHVLNTILGGQFTSRINLNLRERHGFTYGAGSSFNYYQDEANFEVSTSVGIENTAAALNEILNELNNIRNGVTEEELLFAKSSIIRRFPLNFETYRQVSSNIIGKVIYNLPDDYFDSYIQNIESVAIDNVNKAAQQNVFPDSAIIVLVGDKDRLQNQLAGTDFGEIKLVE